MSENTSNSERSYKYFLLGDVTPVRVVYNKAGATLGTETPDPEAKALKVNMDLLPRITQSWEVEEISPEKFEELCESVYLKKKHNGGEGLKLQI